MLLREFESHFYRLKTLYGEKNFPAERERMFFRRYERVPEKAFGYAIDWIVLAMPNPGSLVAILDEKLKDSRQYQPDSEDPDAKPSFKCEPCRDFGYGFIGHTVTACVCPTGQALHPDEILKQQKNYDAGRRFLKTPADLAKFLEGA